MAIWLTLVLLAAHVPLALSACCAPEGRTGVGTFWFINDFAQYEAAAREGATGTDWLVRDPFTAESHAPALMLTLYVAIGKVAALLHVPPFALERAVEALARGLVVLSLWRFARTFGRDLRSARVAFLLTLLGGGLGPLAVIVQGALGVSPAYAGNWSYETNTFGLLFAAPHVPLAMAVTLELVRRLVVSSVPRVVERVAFFLVGQPSRCCTRSTSRCCWGLLV